MATYQLVRGVSLPRPVRQPLYQLDALIENEEMEPITRYESARELVLLWLEKKTAEIPGLQMSLHDNYDHCHLRYGGITIRMLLVKEATKETWAMNFIHPDNTVPTRFWEIQVALTIEDNGIVRLYADVSSSVSIMAEDPLPTVPGFIRAISEQIGISNVHPLSSFPWIIEDEADVETMYQLITAPSRQLPVLVISSPDRGRWSLPEVAPDYLVNAVKIANSCFARCIVVLLPYDMGFRWSDKVGRNWSVFDGSVRIYNPGLNFDTDDIFEHTLYLKNRIINWESPDDLSPYQAFEKYLTANIQKKPTLLLPATERKTFTSLLQVWQEQRRKEDAQNVELLRESYEAQLAAANEEKKFHEDLAEDAFQKYRHCQQEYIELKEKNYNLEQLVDTLQCALKSTGKALKDIIEIPDSYEEMSYWCEKYLAGKLEFTPRARRALNEDNLYRDVTLVYNCLLLLAEEYRNMKMGTQDYSVVEMRLKELQVENRPSVTDVTAGRYEEEYYFTDNKGIKHLADMHLTKGSGRDTRNTLRIYYYWDDQKKKVVIVSLPKHLTTPAT